MPSVYSNKVEDDSLMLRYLGLENQYTLPKKKLNLWKGYLLRYQQGKHMQKEKVCSMLLDLMSIPIERSFGGLVLWMNIQMSSFMTTPRIL